MTPLKKKRLTSDLSRLLEQRRDKSAQVHARLLSGDHFSPSFELFRELKAGEEEEEDFCVSSNGMDWGDWKSGGRGRERRDGKEVAKKRS